MHGDDFQGVTLLSVEVHMPIPTQMCTHIKMYIHICTCTPIHTYAHTIHTFTCARACTNIYTHIHTGRKRERKRKGERGKERDTAF